MTPRLTLTCALIYLASVAMGLAAWLFDWSVWAALCGVMTGGR